MSKNSTLSLQYADIIWDEKGIPTSPAFEDVYFSPINGLAETNYVFLNGNKLEQRFKTLKTGQTFTIIETGFGTGLNLLMVLKMWHEIAPQSTQLHFISTEKFPVTLEDMQKTHAHFGHEVAPYSQYLQNKYLELVQNNDTSITIELGESKQVTVTLLLGDVCASLETLEQKADAWFLDGFSPLKNPEMWNEKLYNLMYKASHKGTTLATFSAASHVRHGLENAGFIIERTKGFAYKKHMTIGYIG